MLNWCTLIICLVFLNVSAMVEISTWTLNVKICTTLKHICTLFTQNIIILKKKKTFVSLTRSFQWVFKISDISFISWWKESLLWGFSKDRILLVILKLNSLLLLSWLDQVNQSFIKATLTGYGKTWNICFYSKYIHEYVNVQSL